MSIFNSVGNWLGKNAGWLEPVVNLGTGLFSAYNKNRTQGNYYDSLRTREDRNFADTKAHNDAYRQWLEQKYAADSSAAASRAAAAAATDANRRAAAKKAQKFAKKQVKREKEYFEPYRQAGLELLPLMTKTYAQGMNNSNLLSAYLNSPGQLVKLNQAALPHENNIKLSSFLRGGN
jgi:hypothetical protein